MSKREARALRTRINPDRSKYATLRVYFSVSNWFSSGMLATGGEAGNVPM